MTDSPIVSVVMSAYNEEKTIAKTIQSILGQTISDFEILVIDDGSTDKTRSIVESFDDPRIRLISNEENIGLPRSLNRGIEQANGRYIARADADEVSHPMRLERQLEAIESQETVCVVGCWYRIIGRKGERIVDIKVPTDRPFDVDDLIEKGPGIAHGSVMMRKEDVIAVGKYREEFTLAQDYDLWLRMAEQFGSGFIHIVPEVLYERRLSPDQIAKRPKQRLFTSVAKESTKCRLNNQSERLDLLQTKVQQVKTKDLSNNERKAMYEYLMGVKLLQEGNITPARKRFLLAAVRSPTNIRPWYQLLLSFLPNECRKKTKNTIQTILEQHSYK